LGYDPAMPVHTQPLSAADARALLRDERDRADELLRRIEEDGWTEHEARGPDAPVRDVTAKRANRQRQIIERMDRLLGYFGDEADSSR
jgi:hypothetical protein